MLRQSQRMIMHPPQRRPVLKKRHVGKRKRTPRTTTTTLSSSSSSEPSLPHDIISFHILPKLPVRCLLRFNCASKLWYTTIHHPNFRASQLSHSKSNNPSLVAMLSAESNSISFLELLKEEGGGHHHHHQQQLNSNSNNIASLELESGSSLIFGTCNGLTCNRIPSAFQICNPSTREVLYFPAPKPTTLITLLHNGFGFDPLTNEYKVLSFWLDSHEYYHCRVYTLGTNKWRNVTATCNLPHCFPTDLTPFCVSGTLFWRTDKISRILSFDVHHENFHLIACPKVPQGFILHTLFDREGRLCLVYRYDDGLKDEVQLTIYTCEDHKQLRLGHIASSARWIKSGYFFLPLKPEIGLIQFFEFAKHIYLQWVTMDGHFILWDVNMKRWIHNKSLGLCTWQWVLLVNHAENLLSLKTFVPPSPGEVEVKYLSSRDAKHDRPDGEMKKKKRRRLVYDSHGYCTNPYWHSIII